MDDWIQPSVGSSFASLAIGGIGLALLFWRRPMLRGTTLMTPWFWASFSIIAISSCEAAIGWSYNLKPQTWHESVRFAAAITVFLPVMAQIGAKRPQDNAWQLIVVSLWVILALPAAKHFAFERELPFEIHGAWQWFLAILFVLSLVNVLPSRFFPSSLLLGTAQILLLSRFLPVPLPSSGCAGPLTALLLADCSIALVAFGFPASRVVSRPEDRVWLDFRDSFGTLWGLRVAERVNAAAEMYNWNVTLTWSGFRVGESDDETIEIPADVAKMLRKTTRGLLRRFVSSEWIARRLEQPNG